jgi:hypothetical protein
VENLGRGGHSDAKDIGLEDLGRGGHLDARIFGRGDMKREGHWTRRISKYSSLRVPDTGPTAN